MEKGEAGSPPAEGLCELSRDPPKARPRGWRCTAVGGGGGAEAGARGSAAALQEPEGASSCSQATGATRVGAPEQQTPLARRRSTRNSSKVQVTIFPNVPESLLWDSGQKRDFVYFLDQV